MTDAVELYGTDIPDAPAERIEVGQLSFSLQGAAIRHIKFGDVELLRGIAFLVRDRDWGTLSPKIVEMSRSPDVAEFGLTLQMTYDSAGAEMVATVNVTATESELSVRATGQVNAAFETNRTGFTILHPAHVSRCPAVVGHSDGSTETTTFPDLIEPWQPFVDITSLTHEAQGFRVTCDLNGDTFEMEDQRQWGDASFKTYNRPLALPWPYEIQERETVRQSVRLRWGPCSADEKVTRDEDMEVTFPDTALVLTAADAVRLVNNQADLDAVRPQRLLCHIDVALGEVEAQIQAFGTLQALVPDIIYDAELICLFAPSVRDELTAMDTAMKAAWFKPDSVLVCPSVDRQSTPPGSEWPDCPPLDEIHSVAAEVFPHIVRGGGMVSFFPELNRKRPPLERLSFVSHGLCPIVHAADDVSVMETLEAIPHILRSAKAILGACEYRLGPSTIAMRQNPYGNRTIPNPQTDRVCMAHDDPRHRARFGAAYTLGVAASIAMSGVSVWTPCAVYGPRGLTGPIVEVIAALARCAGQPVQSASVANGTATLVIGSTKFDANLTPATTNELGPFEWRQSHLDDERGQPL
ncbi:hypothetical protein [Celeribacter sp.]|uniref:hypothetical protein n=1 Tax=Celeribacter sp. TaxID=1890673 RepID=UPI003A948EF8